MKIGQTVFFFPLKFLEINERKRTQLKFELVMPVYFFYSDYRWATSVQTGTYIYARKTLILTEKQTAT